MRTLIAADGSKHGTAGIVSACRLLSPFHRRADLVCVAPRIDQRNSTLQHKLNRRAARTAVRVAKELAAEGMDVKPAMLTGSPVRALAKHSRDYDVTIIGAKSHDEATAMGLGPVASRLIEHIHTSVLVGRNGCNEPAQRILIPVDGSEVALRALEKVNDLLNLSEAEVTLMHVVETPWLHTEADVEAPDEDVAANDLWADSEPVPEVEGEFATEGEAILEAARARLPRRMPVVAMIYEGIPAEQILSEANTGGYDLIVLAAAAEADLKHCILGSVSSKVAWNAPCSVLLVHVND